MQTDLAKSILKDSGYAHGQRKPWESQWQRLADYELPSMADFTQRVWAGQERGSKIVNSTGRLSARECATRVNGFLAGDGTNWFDLRTPEPRIENDPVVRRWLDQVKRTSYAVFQSPGSGFGTSKEPTFKQLVVFGNGPVYIGESPAGWPVYRAEFLGNCAIWTDDDNRPIALFREYEQTAWGLLQQFGREAMPQAVRAVLDNEPQKRFVVVHGVRPRRDSDPYDPAGKPYIEVYVLKSTGDQLGEARGYWEFPWLFPRWNVSPNEVYGRGPGEDALQDVLMLQRMDRDIAEHVAMNVNPQWLTEDEGGMSPRINQKPGGMVYGRLNHNGHWNVDRLGPTGSAAEGMDMRADVIRTIKALFYLDAFRMVEKISEEGSVVHMSATEFAGRQADQFRFAGPALERLRAEFLFPLLARTVAILIRNRKLPPPPPQLRGAPIHPEYVSPLAVAQRASEGTSVLQLINDLLPLASIDQRALDIMNVPAAGRVLARSRHVPGEVLNTPEEIAAIQQARSQAAAQAQATEQMAVASEAAKNNAQAMKLIEGAA